MVHRTVRLGSLGIGFLFSGWLSQAAMSGEGPVKTVHIQLLSRDRPALERTAQVLRRRLARDWDFRATVGQDEPGEAVELLLLWGMKGSEATDHLCKDQGIHFLGGDQPHPEGYALQCFPQETPPRVAAVGVDAPGCLYAVGEILRRLRWEKDGVHFVFGDAREAPAFRFRGSSANQGGTMRKITGARGWSQEEWERYVLDLALSGANCFYAGGAGFDFIKSFHLMTTTGCRPNALSGFPKEWQATEFGNWVCPSIPEARESLMKRWKEEFPKMRDYDIFRIFAGDPGGCRCPRCAPWGKTFIELSEEVAKIWLESHPKSLVQIANQDLTNRGDQAIFDYLNEKPRTWLYGIAYGPGSNAMSSYFRSELREDLFVYPGTGPVNRYLAETLKQLPKDQCIVHYSDITHWISSQYEVAHPEPNLVRVYGRRTFHARPKAYFQVFQRIMPFSEGDIIYSEGYHDELHQYMWNRFLWNPDRSLDDVLEEYCQLHFGVDAAPLMKAAIYQLEANLEEPLATNPGVDRAYLTVKEAGWVMPEPLRQRNHRWILHMQKAALDKYCQLRLRRVEKTARETVQGLQRALRTGDTQEAFVLAKRMVERPEETPEMVALKEESNRLGEESDALYGVRNVGYFRLDRLSRGEAWTVLQLRKALQNDSQGEALAVLRGVAFYEDPGEGGFYDDAGQPGRQPHLVKGDSFDAGDLLDPGNRPSQNTLAYGLTEKRGVSFKYDGLSPKARYRVRMSLVMPKLPKDLLDLPDSLRREQNILADGALLAEKVRIPWYKAECREYVIPRKVTRDGELELSFERTEGGMGTVVSEVWLIRE